MKTKMPSTPKEVRLFLGATNYFNKHIPPYAEFSSALTKLMRANSKFEWTGEHDVAFQNIKNGLKYQIKNSHIEPNSPIDIIVPVSGRAYSGVIMQGGPGKYRCLAFVGKTLSDQQTQYSELEKEYTCIADILKHYGYLLYGKRITIHVEHTWAELATSWPYLSKHIQKATLRIRKFNATVFSLSLIHISEPTRPY